MNFVTSRIADRNGAANHRMHGSGGGQRIFEIKVDSRHPVMRDVIGLNAGTVATHSALLGDQSTMLSFLKKYFERRKLERMRTVFRPGKTVSRFIAKDVKREVLVVSSEEIDAGFVTVKIRTNNILYLSGGLTKESDFGPPERVAIDDLWRWTGKSWGGLADGTSIVDHIGRESELKQTSDNHAVNRSGDEVGRS